MGSRVLSKRGFYINCGKHGWVTSAGACIPDMFPTLDYQFGN